MKIPADIQQAVDTYVACEHVAARAALALDIPITTLKDRLHRAKRLGVKISEKAPPVAKQVDLDRAKQQTKSEVGDLKKKYDAALKTIEQQERDLKTSAALIEGLDTFEIKPKHGSKHSEATVVAVASDWHIEETVGAEVGGLNLYNPDIAKARATKFFQGALRLTNILQQDVTISTMVLPLLGDFISGDIHEEFPEINAEAPAHALVTAQNLIISGFNFLLKNSKLRFVVPCHSGNHARTTRTTRFSSENGHSWEYLLYRHLAAYFRDEPRIEFLIAPGMHSYVQVYDHTLIRFQHGHAVKYGGGVGGVFVPLHKAIAMWNRARHADLDVLGHFHQLLDGGNFIVNGSLIGFNAFALSIKAAYEIPRQALFLIDKTRGRTANWPILVG